MLVRKQKENFYEHDIRGTTKRPKRRLEEVKKTLNERNLLTHQLIVNSNKDEDVASPQGQLRRWHEYFSESQNAPPISRNRPPRLNLKATRLIIQTSEVTKHNIKTAIEKLKAHKTDGLDNISPEILQASPTKIIRIIRSIVKSLTE